jgi:hypothetical protein
VSRILVCFPLNYLLGVSDGNLDPTMPVSWKFADYLEGKDTAVERIMETIDDHTPPATAR